MKHNNMDPYKTNIKKNQGAKKNKDVYLAKSTVAIYQRFLKQFPFRHINYDNIIRFLKHKSISAKKIILCAFLYYLRLTNKHSPLIPRLSNKLMSTQREFEKQRPDNTLSKRQAYNYLDWKKIKKIFLDEIMKDKFLRVRNKLLVGLYILMPPRRALDYGLMYLALNKLPKDKNINYLLKRDGRYFLVFNKYKTSNIYGQYIIAVKEPLLKELIDDTIKNMKDGEKIFPSSISVLLRNIFKKYSGLPISVNILRHSYLSHYTDNGKLNDLAVRKNVSKMMGCSTSRSLSYYVLPDK